MDLSTMTRNGSFPAFRSTGGKFPVQLDDEHFGDDPEFRAQGRAFQDQLMELVKAHDRQIRKVAGETQLTDEGKSLMRLELGKATALEVQELLSKTKIYRAKALRPLEELRHKQTLRTKDLGDLDRERAREIRSQIPRENMDSRLEQAFANGHLEVIAAIVSDPAPRLEADKLEALRDRLNEALDPELTAAVRRGADAISVLAASFATVADGLLEEAGIPPAPRLTPRMAEAYDAAAEDAKANESAAAG